MNDLIIRKVVKEDEAFLLEMLYLSIFIKVGQKPISRDILKEPSISKYVEGWGRDGDIGFIALVNGKPVGSVFSRLYDENNKGYGFVDASTPELGMALIPDYRGKGIGTELLKSLLRELEKQGFKAISLSVNPNNAAIHLYLRFGFVSTGEVVGTYIIMKLAFE